MRFAIIGAVIAASIIALGRVQVEIDRPALQRRRLAGHHGDATSTLTAVEDADGTKCHRLSTASYA